MTARGATLLLRDFVGGVLDAVVPQTCLGCETWIRSGGDRVCSACRARINELSALPVCPRCARTMRPEAIHSDGCARCKHEAFWNVRGVVRVGPDVAPLNGMLRAVKYAGRERHAEFLAELLVRQMRLAEWFTEIEVLVPVPMHRLRRWQRPCDHAEVLALALGRRLNLPVSRKAVRRGRYAPSQTLATTRNERFEQVEGCFEPTGQPRVAGKTVCIVDNLLVSGATLCEVSKALRKAGAAQIYAAVITRTVVAADFQADAEKLGALTQLARQTASISESKIPS